MTAEENPFDVLRLDPTTPAEEIIRAAARQRQQATDDATITRIRLAVQALTGSADLRRLHELLTHARPQYHWPGVERLRATFWRSPCPASANEEICAADLLFDSSVGRAAGFIPAGQDRRA